MQNKPEIIIYDFSSQKESEKEKKACYYICYTCNKDKN